MVFPRGEVMGEGYAWIEVFFLLDCFIDIMRPLDAVLTSYHNARAGLTGILELFSLSKSRDSELPDVVI